MNQQQVNPKRCRGCGLRIRGKNHVKGTHHLERVNRKPK